MTQTQLAAALGKSEDTIWRLETGRTKLTIDVMHQIAQVLGVAPADLLPQAQISDLVADVELDLTAGNSDPLIRTLLAEGYSAYKVLTDAVIEAGYTPGMRIVARNRNGAQAGDCVIAQAERAWDGKRTLILRQYLPPAILTTNRLRGNVVFNYREPTLAVQIVGVVLPLDRQTAGEMAGQG